MPDSAQVAQARALEVPVIVQGAKNVDGTDRRELFTENAKTTLVFDNGAVLNLQWKVTVGQIVFLHNELNKKEVLCHVMDAPKEGQSGATELQFTTFNPEFWHVPGEAPTPSAQIPAPVETPVPQQPVQAVEEAPATQESVQAVEEKPAAQEPTQASPDDSLDMMRGSAGQVTMQPIREELVPAHEMVPTPSFVEAAAAAESEAAPEIAPGAESSEPSGADIDAALRQMSAAPHAAASPETADGAPRADGDADPEHVKSEANLAALMARDARLAKYAAIKEQQVAKIQRETAAKENPLGAPVADAANEPVEEVVPKIPLSERLTTGKNATYTTIAAGFLVVIALGFVANALRGVFFPPNATRPVAAVVKPKTPPAAKPGSPAAASAVGATASAKTASPSHASPAAAAPSSSARSAASAPEAISGPHAVDLPVPAVPVRKVAAARPSAEGDTADTEDSASAESKHRKSTEPDASGNAPARILSQPQPTFPAWAKSLDLDGVVTLDAVIDEKGNIAQTKVLSGPRQLQHSAEQAVGLWEFAPAQSGGKPTSSHLTLTVEFQR
jgi:TonB family protein